MTNFSTSQSETQQDSSALDDVGILSQITLHAFLKTPTADALVNAVFKDRRMMRCEKNIFSGGIQGAIQSYQGSRTPHILIIEIPEDQSSVLSLLEKLASVCDEQTKLVLIGSVNDVTFYRKLIDRGVSEYLTLPLDPSTLMRTFASLYAPKDLQALSKNIVFFGVKGGVGSSILAHNFGALVSQDFDLRTIVVDLDLPFGTLNINFNQEAQTSLAETLDNPSRIDTTVVERSLIETKPKLKLLCAPVSLQRTYDFSEKNFHPLVDELRGLSEVVIYDLPHLWARWTRDLMIQADYVVFVATPDLYSLRNARNFIEFIRKERKNDSPPFIILNQVNVPKRREIQEEDFARAIGLSITQKISFAPLLFSEAISNGITFAEVDKTSEVVKNLKNLSLNIFENKKTNQKEKSIFKSILGRCLPSLTS